MTAEELAAFLAPWTSSDFNAREAGRQLAKRLSLQTQEPLEALERLVDEHEEIGEANGRPSRYAWDQAREAIKKARGGHDPRCRCLDCMSRPLGVPA